MLSSEDIAFNSLYRNWSYIFVSLISRLKGDVFLWRYYSVYSVERYRVILPRLSCVNRRRNRSFTLCARVGLSTTLLRFISLNAHVFLAPHGFPPRTKNWHVRRKYIAHVGAVTKDVSANLPRKGNFLHFSPRASLELGARGKFSSLKYRGNQSPAWVAAIAALFSALFPALGREVMG